MDCERENYDKSNILIELFNRSHYKRLINCVNKYKYINKWDRRVELNLFESPQNVINMYESHVRHIKDLSREYVFESFFLQPNLFSKARSLSFYVYESDMIDKSSTILAKSQRHRLDAHRSK